MADEFVAGLRTCTKCGREKPLDEFAKNAKCLLGRLHQCNACRSHAAVSNAARAKERAAKRRLEKPKEVAAEKASWRRRNRDKCREANRRYMERNPDRVAETRRRSKEKSRSNPRNRIADAVAAGIRDALRGKKAKRTFEMLGYTVEDLMAHLEQQFLPGMTWDNYGLYGWHIDHEIPLSAFNYQTPEDMDFHRAWGLENLRPLWASDNLSKSNKLAAPFQPSLSIGV